MTDRQLSITSMTTSVVMFIGMMLIHFNPLGIQKLKPKVNAGTIEITDVNGLQDALDAKANANHTHTIDNIDSLQGALDGKEDKTQ